MRPLAKHDINFQWPNNQLAEGSTPGFIIFKTTVLNIT